MDNTCDARLEFEIATFDPAVEVTTLLNSAFRSKPTGQAWLYDSQKRHVDVLLLEATQDIMKFPNSLFLIGPPPESPIFVASCVLRRPADPPAPYMSDGAAWFGLLTVKPDQHSRGYGKVVLLEAERFVSTSWGVKRVEMEHVNTRVQLGTSYQRCGYDVTGKRRNFPYGDNCKQIFVEGLELLVIGTMVDQVS
jgi:hypothetical protein